jgi:hypothetical protein
MESGIDEQAMHLLRVMNDRQAKGDTSANVFPHEVAHEVGLDPQSSDYEEVLDDLRTYGCIKETFISEGFKITSTGMARLAEED